MSVHPLQLAGHHLYKSMPSPRPRTCAGFVLLHLGVKKLHRKVLRKGVRSQRDGSPPAAAGKTLLLPLSGLVAAEALVAGCTRTARLRNVRPAPC